MLLLNSELLLTADKRIVLFDTLVEQCKEEEVVAVLAHELGAPARLWGC